MLARGVSVLRTEKRAVRFVEVQWQSLVEIARILPDCGRHGRSNRAVADHYDGVCHQSRKFGQRLYLLRYENMESIDDLKTAVAETEEANRTESVFIASASHDLRQPIHAMGLLVETWKRTRSG